MGKLKKNKEVRAICFIAKYTTKKAIGYNFFNYYNFRTCETSVILFIFYWLFWLLAGGQDAAPSPVVA